ncbi:MAG: glutaredoxin family protein [Gammaproteobacteria bacterium]|nr:glutaredoxin family protein [Gammaproteobacteria bacterium]
MRHLIVYIRRGCHLCSDMTQALEHLRHELEFTYSTIDIDPDPELVSRYGSRVPVLAEQDIEICYYFLEEDRLRAHCSQADTPRHE